MATAVVMAGTPDLGHARTGIGAVVLWRALSPRRIGLNEDNTVQRHSVHRGQRTGTWDKRCSESCGPAADGGSDSLSSASERIVPDGPVWKIRERKLGVSMRSHCQSFDMFWRFDQALRSQRSFGVGSRRRYEAVHLMSTSTGSLDHELVICRLIFRSRSIPRRAVIR